MGADQEIRGRIHAAARILLVSHIRPDGDAVGSLCGLGLALLEAGKDVQLVLSDGVPSALRQISGSEHIIKKAQGPFDLIITLDCSDLDRTGKALLGFPPPNLNIDHHITNTLFAEINLVEPESAATSAVIAAHLANWGLHLSEPSASALLAGIISDTIGFRTSNMTPSILRQAADLMDVGADLPTIYSHVLVSRSYESAAYWGWGLSRLQRLGKLVWTSLTLADRKAASYNGNDDADLINILSAINDAEIAIIFVEQVGGHTKVSWRAVPGLDVSGIALSFGGGGHPAAAGADISGSLEEVQAAVLKATQLLLDSVTVTQDEVAG